MASKRMFSCELMSSDTYFDLPFSAQALYVRLNLEADDYGFMDAPRRVVKSLGCSDDDLAILVNGGFIYVFPSGVVVIMGWWVNNSIQPTKRKPTRYQDEYKQLGQDDTGAYNLKFLPANGGNCPPKGGAGRPSRLGKNRLDKDRKDKCKRRTPTPRGSAFTPPTKEEVEDYVKRKGYQVDPGRFVDFYGSKGWVVGKSRMVDWHCAVANWARNAKKGGSVKNADYETIISAIG